MASKMAVLVFVVIAMIVSATAVPAKHFPVRAEMEFERTPGFQVNGILLSVTS